MKKIKIYALTLILLAGALVCGGCVGMPQGSTSGKPHVVVTVFPVWDWTRNLAGDHADVTLLVDNGVDLHSYQPTADDIIQIASCDVFVYVGGESDEWVTEALQNTPNPQRTVINLLDVLGDAAREEEHVEGMQVEPDEDNETAYDEHVWLSLKNAAVLCEAITDALIEHDGANKTLYADKRDAYVEKLSALDSAYAAVTQNAPQKTLLFADRFPFLYLVKDYGLEYYAAFSGCSAETEASFDTVIFLANKADECGLHAILQLESADGSLARTVRDSTQNKDQRILTMDSLQSVGANDIENGASYLTAMQNNLAVLKEALQ